jgi:ketosteroid isomerase-like protein
LRAGLVVTSTTNPTREWRHVEEGTVMAKTSSTDEPLAELVGRTEEAAAAWMRGDMDRYLALTRHAPGFTLMDPGGGPARRFEDRAGTFTGWKSPFSGGEAILEHVETHAWDDTAVLVMIERQHGQVGDLPDQDLSVRVTHVYRREGSDWLLVHRHADPLVHPIDLSQIAALARGDKAEASAPTPEG